MYPSTEVVALAILIGGDVPPDDTTGAVPVTIDTAAPEVMLFSLLANVLVI
jgi:hypothetical protein